MTSGALALLMMIASHQYIDAYDPDPLIAKAPAHQAQKYMDVATIPEDVTKRLAEDLANFQHEIQMAVLASRLKVDDDDNDAPNAPSGLVCADEHSKEIFVQGMNKVFIMAEALQQRGAPQEKISAFVDAQLKHGMEVLHCHL